jgi:geranylgeranyl transferase type-2 subunit alpha
MHNVKKKQLSSEQVAARREENVKRGAHYSSLSRAAMARRVAGMFDLDSLTAAAKVIEINPDHSTLWNFRRECLQALHGEISIPAAGDAGAADSLRQACEGEFALTQACLALNPKSYPVWFHRMWVLQWGRCEWAYPRELKLTTKLLALDDRNFHCWTHRRFVVRASSVPGRAELQFTLEKVRVYRHPCVGAPKPKIGKPHASAQVCDYFNSSQTKSFTLFTPLRHLSLALLAPPLISPVFILTHL